MKILFALLLFAPSLMAQNWVKAANEGDTVTASAVTVRYGYGSTWTAPQVMSGTFVAGNSLFGDPFPNVLKELDVLETASAQTVIVDGTSVIIPALPAAPLANTVIAPSTVTTKAQPITTTAPVLPAGTNLCSVPKNGGACKTSVPIALAPLTATVPSQTAPVTVSGQGFSLACPTAPTISQPSVSGCTLTVSQ